MKRLTITSLYSLFALFLIAGCDGTGLSTDSTEQPDQANAPQASSSKVAHLSGKDIYKGLLFNQGEAAFVFSDLFRSTRSDLSAEEIASVASDHVEGMTEENIRDAFGRYQTMDPEERRKAINSLFLKVTNHVEQADPTFFSRFEERMKSGNHLKIERALAEMSDVTITALANVLGVSKDVITGRSSFRVGEGIGTGKCIFVVVVGAIGIAVAAGVVVTVFAAVHAVVTKVVVGDATSQNSSQRLEREMIVDRVAERLAHGR